MGSAVIETVVQQNLAVYRAAPSRLQEDVSQEAQVASDYRGRLVYELLQNADDAMEGNGPAVDRVTFIVTDDELWMANNGRELSESDVQGLCGLGASSKVDAHGICRASIGHKGLGFKSVLEVTDRPVALSLTHSFELGTGHARGPIDELWADMGLPTPRSVPAMRFPVQIDSTPTRWQDLRRAGYNTAFVFPFKPDLDTAQRRSLADRLIDLPLTTVLFLKHLEEVDLIVHQAGRNFRRRWRIVREISDGRGGWTQTSGMIASGLYRIRVETEDGDGATFLVAHDANVKIGAHRLGLSGPAWDGVELAEVSIAAIDPASSSAPMPEAWRRFHVFLPTEEPCAYPLLVNGAFTTDLSRQRVWVGDDRSDYNAHLIRSAAALFRRVLLPELRRHSTSAVLSVLERHSQLAGEASDALHTSLSTELAEVPLFPTEDGSVLCIPEAVLPPAILENEGKSFREVLSADARWSERLFPSAEYCTGRWSAVAADHGALSLSPPDALTVLAALADSQRSALYEDESGGFEIDPVLELCVALWERSDGETRDEVERRAKIEPLFPVQRNDDGTVVRVTVGDDTAFYPPRSAKHELPLHGLRFMCHDVCWGALLPKERAVFLEDRMKAWAALFDIKEFRFEEVMRAAVIPALVLNPEPEVMEMRERLQSMNALSAICQLAGTYTKPDRPLRYQRLRSDRALFNLSRLPVPCRTADGEEAWLPSYRVYFGRDWIGDNSVEAIIDAAPDPELDGNLLQLPILVGPERFLGRLRGMEDMVDSEDDATEDDDEVGIDEDTDRALESDERDRWVAFLSWIGVNQALRPVHFHDVEDRDTGWLTTKELTGPGGWAFSELGATWEEYRNQLLTDLRGRDEADETVPYLYDVHDLEGIVPLLAAAENDPDGNVARALIEHVIRHWDFYEPFAGAQLALVKKGKYPSQRSKPPRALPEELAEVGDNLWLWRLRQRNICPTTHGPRRPDRTWLPSGEVQRRFGRRGRSPGDLLPLLDLDEGLPARLVRDVAERLGVRLELSPTTFAIDDARLLCERLEEIYQQQAINTSQLRMVIRPVYRELFELLSGRSSDEPLRGTLADAPLLTELNGEFGFMPARQVLYARTPGFRKRSGIDSQLPSFVLDAEPGATAPLTRLFNVAVFEESLDWHPDPGECPLDPDELARFRSAMLDLVPDLLARLRAERTETRDRAILEQFARLVEPVDSLTLGCTFNGEDLDLAADREYFVTRPSDGELLQAFILWDGQAWPPGAEEAQRLAMALADAIGVNLVETFLAFLQSDREQRRRLLDIAGATSFLAEIEEELAGPIVEDESPAMPAGEIDKTISPEAEADHPERPATIPTSTEPAEPRIPLLRFEDLTIDGEPLLVHGDMLGDTESVRRGSRKGGDGAAESTSHRAAPATDLSALDHLGMQIAITYELKRLKSEGARQPAFVATDKDPAAEDLVVDVSTPAAITRAEQFSPVAKEVLADLERRGLSLLHPGFDLLTIRGGRAQRLIELKSSGVDARVQAMTWNEWKSASRSDLRAMFWLYLVGNLRADLPGTPYVRAINDPFGSLTSQTTCEQVVRRAIQLRVREFHIAEELVIGLRANDDT